MQVKDSLELLNPYKPPVAGQPLEKKSPEVTEGQRLMALYMLASLAQNAEAVFNVQVKVRPRPAGGAGGLPPGSASQRMGRKGRPALRPRQDTAGCCGKRFPWRQGHLVDAGGPWSPHARLVVGRVADRTQHFIESIWYSLRDPKLNIREAAVMALKVRA